MTEKATPTNKEEYLARFHMNQRIEGFGLDTTTHLPCPFCAAAGFMVLPVTSTHEALDAGATCKECGRSARGLITRTPTQTTMEMVQTGGDDPPDWTPKMRRV